MWLFEPRRVALITTALATASITLVVGSRADVWGTLIVLALAVTLVGLTVRYAARAGRDERLR